MAIGRGVGEISRRDVKANVDKRVFRQTANATHYINRARKLMRGGIRL